jgi:hypothetical protein
MIGKVIKLAIFLVVAHALYQFVPTYLRYQQFKDDVRQTALFSRELDEPAVVDKVMEQARERQLPLEREAVRVRKVNTETLIDASYVERVKFVPGYIYPWEFAISIGPGGR